MIDFAQFRNDARAEFSSLNITVGISEAQTATSTGLTMYQLKAQGLAIGPEVITVEASSPKEAITALRRLVGIARRTHRASCEATAQARPRPVFTATRYQGATRKPL